MQNPKNLFNVPLFLVLLVFGFVVKNASADPYNLDLLDSSCLANDITTGPLGWYCETSSGHFIITFFGIDQAGVNGQIVKVNIEDCNTFSINVEPPGSNIIESTNNKPPVVGSETGSTDKTNNTNETEMSHEAKGTSNTNNVIKEGVTSFNNVELLNGKQFSAVKSSDKELSSNEIRCTYFPPPFKGPKPNESNK
jgi:hypothetical protein